MFLRLQQRGLRGEAWCGATFLQTGAGLGSLPSWEQGLQLWWCAGLGLQCGGRSTQPAPSSLSGYRKAEGKAAATSELPPEYLTSPLSQQSQVSGCAAGDPVTPTRLSVPVLTPSPSVRLQLPPKRDETALQEEEELQLAIALSQSEAEEKERMVRALLGIWEWLLPYSPDVLGIFWLCGNRSLGISWCK